MPTEQPGIAEEITRAEGRRARLKIARPEGHADKQWALCLSGGGIRSATFCLGVLQGLAKSAPPRTPVPPPSASPLSNSAAAAAPATLLPQFDYVSTVSGGGYVGSFFTSLFVKGRLSGNEHETNETTSARAYDALTEEPPERMHSSTKFDAQRPGKAALAWLRDNGRYLAPTGSGDMIYAAAIGLRNWFATHYVIATLLLLALSISLSVRVFASTFDEYASIAALLRPQHLVWWSFSWVFVAVIIALGVVPAGVGFWFTHPSKGKTVSDEAKIVTSASVAATLAGLGGCAIAYVGMADPAPDPAWTRIVLAIGVATLLGVACFAVTRRRLTTSPASVDGPKYISISAHRVVMTRWLTTALTLTALFIALASVETLSQTIALHVEKPGASFLSFSSIAGALVWFIRFVAQRMGEKSQGGGVIQKLPWDVLAGALALLLWLLVTVLYELLLLWVVGNGRPDQLFEVGPQTHVQLLTALGATAFLVMFGASTGRFPGFLNLSTFQGLYSARLTRAYLGASNFVRFAQANSRWHSVAEPAPGDNLTVKDLHANDSAPVHYINVCVNQNVDPSAQLVQRDRKGKPFVIAPNGFYLDGTPYPFPASSEGELASSLTVGEWVGVSGAAFTTGLGRSTTLGGSLLLGFANVRLGRWWKSGARSAAQARPSLMRTVFGTQLYLLDEIRARFHGTRLPYQYLSDGGHFENTAAYEMVRPGRDIALLVVCDCGADPDYVFDDLANLIRLARIDHGVEISVNRGVATHPVLGRRFGLPEDFERRADGTLPVPAERCAMLLDVRVPVPVREATSTADPLKLAARIVLLKPNLLADMSADVRNYADQHAAFPQEPTIDQFFNEGQWESYRKLGLEVALKVFPQAGGDNGYRDAFWQAVLV